ncbi:MAG TPA: hypothetical protein VGX68_06595 [Thermoanaerobaculia bacterium]|nr:hypothetical protein [Thermoanaerobaculia bacterium]
MITDAWLPPEDRNFLRSATEAWDDPETRRMTLVMLRMIEAAKSRDIAKALGVSIFTYQYMELGREPLSRKLLVKAAIAMKVPHARLEWSLRVTDDMLVQIRDSWPKKWREVLEPLSAEERIARISSDRELHNWGLGELLCTQSLETEDPTEAVELAKLALLVMQKANLQEDFRRRLEGYAWGHVGHALRRHGDSGAAEQAFARAIELWTTGRGSGRTDRAHAARLAEIVPSFPPYEPVSRRRAAVSRRAS